MYTARPVQLPNTDQPVLLLPTLNGRDCLNTAAISQACAITGPLFGNLSIQPTVKDLHIAANQMLPSACRTVPIKAREAASATGFMAIFQALQITFL